MIQMRALVLAAIPKKTSGNNDGNDGVRGCADAVSTAVSEIMTAVTLGVTVPWGVTRCYSLFYCFRLLLWNKTLRQNTTLNRGKQSRPVTKTRE